MLIKGKNLNQNQKQQVLRSFIYRWTTGNDRREEVYRGRSTPRIPLQTDEEWLADHAFYFIKDGSRMTENRRQCEPAYMADREESSG